MKSCWIVRAQTQSCEQIDRARSLVVFFGGFACDTGLMKLVRLPKNCDILMFYDYRGLECEINPDEVWRGYSHVGVVAWSFGIAVAEQFKKLSSSANVKIALCTTCFPIDEERGIPLELFQKTLQNLDEAGLAKFFKRVCGFGPDSFEPSKKMRKAGEYRSELLFLGSILIGKNFANSRWDYALAARQDRIFARKNVERAWGEKVVFFDGAHFDISIFETAFAAASKKPDSFVKNAATYDSAACVQAVCAQKLSKIFLSQFSSVPKFSRILEIGCGTGLLTKILFPRFPSAKWILNDGSFPSAVRALKYCGDAAQILCADAERDFIGRNYDLIVSASCFQWIENPSDFFKKLFDISSDGAMLAFSSFGSENFTQIRRLCGRGLNSPSAAETKTILESAGFEVLSCFGEIFSEKFASPADVLRRIHDTGVNAKFSSFWTPRAAREFARKYREFYGGADGSVSLNWNPVYAVVRKNKK